MKLFLFVSLLGTALASPGGIAYDSYSTTYGSSYSTAHGPLARASLAYGSYAAAPAYATHGALVAGSPVTAYAAAPPAVATYATASPAVAAYTAAAPSYASYAASPVSYAAAAPAYGSYAASPVSYAAAAPAYASYAASPVSYAAAPISAYAAAPAAAVVPVARVSAQPAVVQNVVDVAQPKLATRRFEIRRPAIQKQFYDIEERVVIRPAGSAVVELETPIGANQRGPTKIRPAASPVVLNSYGSAHLASHVSHAFLPTAPIAVPANPQYQEVEEQNQETQEISQQPEQAQQLPAQSPQQPTSQPSIPQQDTQQQEFDDSDSVSIDNPEISSRVSQPPSPAQQRLPSTLFRSQFPQFLHAEAPLPQFSISSLPEQLRSDGIPSFSRSRITQFVQPESQFQQEVSSQSPPLARAQSSPRIESTAPQQQESDLSFIRNQLPTFTSQTQVSERQGSSLQQQSESSLEARSFEGETVISSARNLSPEQSQANQARLIELLTARGPVSEVRSASDPVRGRVISATPAPEGAEPANERVNTRRVVVNRPIQTVQEVDVVQPFTKLERVAVHQPAVVKTAHYELAAVPAAVPALHAAVTVAPHYYK